MTRILPLVFLKSSVAEWRWAKIRLRHPDRPIQLDGYLRPIGLLLSNSIHMKNDYSHTKSISPLFIKSIARFSGVKSTGIRRNRIVGSYSWPTTLFK